MLRIVPAFPAQPFDLTLAQQAAALPALLLSLSTFRELDLLAQLLKLDAHPAKA